MLALGWLLSSATPMDEKINQAIKALRKYKFDEGKPLARKPRRRPHKPKQLTGFNGSFINPWTQDC
jgi:hypothetical protein